MSVSELKHKFTTWWRDLADADHDGLNRNRAQMAHLQRLRLTEYGDVSEPDVIKAFGIDAFKTLHAIIKPPREHEADLVVVAYVLGHIRKTSDQHPAAALGQGDPPRMNATAFTSLMRSETTGQLFEHARRIAALLEQSAHVGELSASLYLWRRAPHIRREWARAYYGLDTYGF